MPPRERPSVGTSVSSWAVIRTTAVLVATSARSPAKPVRTASVPRVAPSPGAGSLASLTAAPASAPLHATVLALPPNPASSSAPKPYCPPSAPSIRLARPMPTAELEQSAPLMLGAVPSDVFQSLTPATSRPS